MDERFSHLTACLEDGSPAEDVEAQPGAGERDGEAPDIAEVAHSRGADEGENDVLQKAREFKPESGGFSFWGGGGRRRRRCTYSRSARPGTCRPWSLSSAIRIAGSSHTDGPEHPLSAPSDLHTASRW